ncbi:MAG: RDD family protein, partial [Chloroflexi bacterium]|nr:RDD family protein [Chloroflexota bacterium]
IGVRSLGPYGHRRRGGAPLRRKTLRRGPLARRRKARSMEVTLNGKRLAPRTAPIPLRIVAFALDLLISVFIISIPALGVDLMTRAAPDAVAAAAQQAVGFIAFALYQGLLTAINQGRTLGMYMCKVQVLNAVTLEEPSLERGVLRGFALSANFAAAVFLSTTGPFYIAGPLGMVFLLLPALLRSDGRAVHDLLSGTRVVRTGV